MSPGRTFSFSSRRCEFLACLTILAVVAISPAQAQDSKTEKKGPERWETDIQNLESKIKDGTSSKGSILFVGSSSIRLWDLKKSFPDVPAVNHGFGGSVLADSVHFFDRIVTPLQPRVIVVYAGDNDIAAGTPPETVLSDFGKFVQLADEKVPQCERIIFIAIKPSTKRWALADKQISANQQISAMCGSHPKCRFLDIWPLMLNDQGMPRKDLLRDDGLHLTDDGYAVWNKAILPLLGQP